MTPRKEESVKRPMALLSNRYGGAAKSWGS